MDSVLLEALEGVLCSLEALEVVDDGFICSMC